MKPRGFWDRLLQGFRTIDEDVLDVIEKALSSADVGTEATAEIMIRTRAAYRNGEVRTADQLLPFLKAHLQKRRKK